MDAPVRVSTPLSPQPVCEVTLTQSLNDQGAHVCCYEDACAPPRADDRYIFTSSYANSAAKHHVDSGGEEERTAEEKDTLGYEGTPVFVVVVGADAGAVAAYFA